MVLNIGIIVTVLSDRQVSKPKYSNGARFQLVGRVGFGQAYDPATNVRNLDLEKTFELGWVERANAIR